MWATPASSPGRGHKHHPHSRHVRILKMGMTADPITVGSCRLTLKGTDYTYRKNPKQTFSQQLEKAVMP